MTPELINRARIFRDAYAELLAAWRADEIPTLDQATAICYKSYRAEYDFLYYLLDYVSYYTNSSLTIIDQLRSVMHGIGLFDPNGTTRKGSPISILNIYDLLKEKDNPILSKLNKAVCLGKDWISWDSSYQNPKVTVEEISNTMDHIQMEVGYTLQEPSSFVTEQTSSIPVDVSIDQNMVPVVTEIPDADTEASEDNPRDIPRSQSIALLYAVFVRLKVTQTYSDTAVARLIEAITGGKIRNGKNSYAWKHRNDKLQPDVEALLDEFMKGGQSSE